LASARLRRRYLKTPDEKHFEIDDDRVIEDPRYDGAVMLRCRELLRVEGGRTPSSGSCWT
jgi:hypothetical protein